MTNKPEKVLEVVHYTMSHYMIIMNHILFDIEIIFLLKLLPISNKEEKIKNYPKKYSPIRNTFDRKLTCQRTIFVSELPILQMTIFCKVAFVASLAIWIIPQFLSQSMPLLQAVSLCLNK